VRGRFSFTGHESVSFPVSPQSDSKYLSYRTHQTDSVHRKLSLPPVAIKFEDVACKTAKALLGLDQKKEAAELLGAPDDGDGGCVCVPSPACKHFPMQYEPGAGHCPWTRLLRCQILAASSAASQSPGKGCKENSGFQPSLLTGFTHCVVLSRVAALGWPSSSGACTAMLGWARRCWAHGEGSVWQQGEALAAEGWKGLGGGSDSHILQKEPEGWERGKGSRGMWTATLFSDAALGRAQPYLQNREEEEDGVSHRKPGGWILSHLNHQDSLQISSKLVRRLRQCCKPGGSGTCCGLQGTECLLVRLVIPKARWNVLG